MNCGNCARKITSLLQQVTGVQSVETQLETRTAIIHWAAQPENGAALKMLASGGYPATLVEAVQTHAAQRQSAWHTTLWVGAACTLPLLLGEWVARVGMEPWFRWVSFLLAGIVQVYCGAGFYRGAWQQLRVRAANMDTLVSLGSTTAFGYSVWALFAGWPGHLYFMEAAAIITVVSAGHWLEARVGARAADALNALLSLTPKTARRLDAHGVEHEVAVAELNLGDLLVLRPGETVPVDGEVVEGASSVNESMLTGESLPSDKVPGRPLYAGTANLNGRLVEKVTAVGQATALARIINAVRRAQTSAARIQRLGDRVSSVFVPLVLIVAMGAALWWGLAYESAVATHEHLAQLLWPMPVAGSPLAAAFIIAAAVLIIACPCAMGLATPTAIMAAANVAARRGILIRDAVALEKAGEISAVIFDKTGTLTQGKPAVAAWEILPGADTLDRDQLQGLAVSAAHPSAHPFSQAVAALGGARIGATEWNELRGAGVQARIPIEGREHSVRLGSLRWLRKAAAGHETGRRFIEEWSGRGASVLGLAVDERLAALFAVQDPLKPGAADVVRSLERKGIEVFLVTGDHAPTAATLAAEAGIAADRVHSEMLPEQKADFVKGLQERGARVAFVGDGINDAPALEQAHLGIAVTKASDIAREAADIVLLRSDIEGVPDCLGLAQATLRTIHQNLFWAFFYNAAAVPLAVLGFLSPILCAVAMGASDLIVIGNALRLKGWKSGR